MEEFGRLYRMVGRGIRFEDAYPPGDEPKGIARDELQDRYQSAIAATKAAKAKGIVWTYPFD